MPEHEERRFVESRLRKERRKTCTSNIHWREGQIDRRNRNKIDSRKTQTLNDECKEETTTQNKLIIDIVVDHVIAIKGNVAELKEINKSGKHKREMLPDETLSSNGVTLTVYDRDKNEFSSIGHEF